MVEDEGGDSLRSYIRKIELENFMSHRKFELELTSTLNLIVGRNGSGKSSVLTALIVALGGRAAATSRSNSVADLVKTGAEAAYITIHFVNSPANASLMQKYGAEFSIERRISAKKENGQLFCSNTYRIRNAAGKEISRRAKDVEDIAIQFGIFPDNPLAMLTQEQAKEFLVTASAAKKYQRLKAALYQHHLTHYVQEVEETMDSNRKTIDQCLMQQVHIEANMESLDKTLQQAEELASREEYTRKLNAILKWKKWQKQRACVSDKTGTVQRIRRELHRMETELDPKKRLEELSAEQDEIQSVLSALDETLSGHKSQSAELQQKLEKTKRRYHFVCSEIEDAKSEQSTAMKSLRQLEEAGIAESPEEVAKKKQDLETNLRNIEISRVSIQSELEENGERETEVSAKAESVKEELQNINRRLQTVRQEIKDTEIKISDANRTRDRQGLLPSGFPHEFSKLEKLIQRTKWRGSPPIGPLGHYIDLRSEFGDYLPMIQMIYTNQLSSYWVQTAEDQNTLARLMREAGVNKARTYNRELDDWNFHQVTPKESQEYHRLLEDILTFRSDNVARALIDSAHAEGHVILRDDKGNVAQKSEMLVKANNSKIRSVYVASIGNSGSLNFGGYSISGNTLSYSSVAAWRGGPRIHMESGAEVKNLQHLLKELKFDRQSLESDRDRTEAQLSEHRSLMNQLQVGRAKSQRQLERLSNEERRIKTELRQLPSAEDLAAAPSRIEAQIAVARQRYEMSSTALATASSTLQSIQGHVQAAQDAYDENIVSTNALQKQRVDHLNHIGKIGSELSDMERSKRLLATHIQHKREALSDAEQVESNELQLLESVRDVALELGPNPEETPEAYESEDLELRSRQIQQKILDLEALQERSQVTPEQLEETRVEKERQKLAYAANQTTLKVCMRMADTVTRSHEKRTTDSARMWQNARRAIIDKFGELLAQRRFKGNLDINDHQETLETSATPEQSASRAAATLSGGERSFSQIALLISVWEAMHAGLVAVDEYDVFMDKANRSVSLNLLTESVKAHNMQCLLITPQDIDLQAVDAEFREHIKVHRLRPPVREQT